MRQILPPARRSDPARSREGMRHSTSAVATPMNASSPCDQSKPARGQIETQMVRRIGVMTTTLTRNGMP